MNDNVEWIVGLIFGLVIGLLVGAHLGINAGQNGERRHALEAGVARWEVDSSTGQTRFIYGAKGEQPAENEQ